MFNLSLAHESANVRRFAWYYAIGGLTMTLPIWVAFYLRILTFEQMATISASGNLIGIILQIPTGALADIVGRKRMITIGQIMRALGFALLPFANSFWVVFAFSTVISIGEAMVSGADSALLYDTLKEEGREDQFANVYTKILTYYRIALIVGSFVGGLSYTIWYGVPYFLRGISMLFSAHSISQMYESNKTNSKFHLSTYLNKTKLGMSEIIKSNFVKKLTFYYIVVGGITWSCIYYFNQPFAYDFGWTTNQMSYITPFVYLVSNLIILYFTSNKQLLTRERVYLGFPIVMIVALLPGMFVGKWVALALMALSQAAGSGRFSILDRYINMEFDSSHRATALSALNMLVSLVMTALIFLGGKVQTYGDTRMVYSLLGLLSLIFAVPISLILVRDHRKYKKGIITQ